MLLTGQPLHAFDFDRVAGGHLVVRRAADGEQIETLDGQTRTLDGEMVLIEDDEGPTSIAGVMGGARSEVVPETTRVLMEAATWDGPNIHRTSWTLALRSEASGRFEKGLQPEQAMHAQAIATRLMLELTGARLMHRDDRPRRTGSARRSRSVCVSIGYKNCSARPSRASARPRFSRRWTSRPSRRTTGCSSACPPCGAPTSRARRI